MQAELFSRVAEMKSRDLSGIRNWRAFLAQSLYNAAKNIIRHDDAVRHHGRALSIDGERNDSSSGLGRKLIAPAEPIESRLHIGRVWAALTPEMRNLAQLLLEEGGKTSGVARRLGRPRKTVAYWIAKLRSVLKKHGLQ
jgi:DNA-directed RNA polymerase specialized sigma24 family protein